MGTTRQHASLATAKLIFSYSAADRLRQRALSVDPAGQSLDHRDSLWLFRNRPISLAYDLGSKAIQAIGSTLDVVLFQIAVALHDQHGPSKAKTQVARNMAIVIAVVLPACTGIWLTLPSVENVVVPVAYRGTIRPIVDAHDGRPLQFRHRAIWHQSDLPDCQGAHAPLIAAAVIACSSTLC